MRNPKPLLAVAGVATLAVFVALFWRERSAGRVQTVALVEARTRIVALEGELVAARTRAEERAAPARTEMAPPPGPPEAERGRPPGRGRRGGELAELLNDPAVAPLVQKQRQRQVATRYAALIAKLGLSGGQAAQLQELLADKQLSRSEAQAMARQQGLDRTEARDLARQSDVESDAAIKALVGDTAFAQLQEYDRTMPQRTSVNGLATQLVATGSPLSVAQQERLVGTLAAHASTDLSVGFTNLPDVFGLGGGNLAAGFFFRGQSPERVQALVDRKAAGDAAVLEEAAQFLNAAQLAALRQQQEEQAEQLVLAAKLAERMRRDRAGE